MVSISGIRGIIGKSLTPAIIQKYSLAFGNYLKNSTVVVGGDSRTSGTAVRNIVKGCLESSGCRVIDIGIVPTPTVQMEILYHKARGGIAITASHNPVEWNGLKFMDASGCFLNAKEAEKLFSIANQEDFSLQKWDNMSEELSDSGANERHISSILNLPFIDVKSLKKRKFTVVIDCVNGAGGIILPKLLHHLGCDTIVLNEQLTGIFAHNPEPLPENLTQLSQKVKQTNADLGFAVDPDVDRCAIIDNSGEAIGEEYTLAGVVKFILSKKLGTVVVNMSTSKASEDIAKYYNCPFTRTKVGEINVVEEMKKCNAVIGGEGNGGVILPDLHLGRDSLVAIALTLQYLMESGKSMKEMFLSLPQYKIVKQKLNIEKIDPDIILKKLAERYGDQKLDLLDGVRIDYDNYWIHLRKSNTEPIIRVITEAPTKVEAEKLANKYSQEIKGIVTS
jgi:phosphomannomutase